jgi:hypothetical protein
MNRRHTLWVISTAKNLNTTILAAIVYAAFAVYLYRPYFNTLTGWRWLLPINLWAAAFGCYVLSLRWVGAFPASLFAGAVYGFGPFMLNLSKFHPVATSLAASIPWLFCPAAFFGKNRRNWISIPLSVLPFLVIVLFFQVAAQYRLFAVPVHIGPNPRDLFGIIAPAVIADRAVVLAAFYHVPIAALTMGLAMSIANRRAGPLTLAALGIVLTLCPSFAQVSPIMWLSVSMVCGSVLIGAGMQGLACAGFPDRKWVLLAGIVAGALAIVTLLPAAGYFQTFLGCDSSDAILLTQAGKTYILAAITMAAIFFMVRAKLRLSTARWIILCLAMAVDIFFTARLIVDKIL